MRMVSMTAAYAAEIVTWRRGREAIRTGLDFGRREFAPAAFRVTVATFNKLALRVVGSVGFRPVASFLSAADLESFEILVRPEPS